MKSTTYIEERYCPAGLKDDGTWQLFHDHIASDILGAKQEIKNIKADFKKYPRVRDNCTEFKIMKSTRVITTTEWEEVE